MLFRPKLAHNCTSHTHRQLRRTRSTHPKPSWGRRRIQRWPDWQSRPTAAQSPSHRSSTQRERTQAESERTGLNVFGSLLLQSLQHSPGVLMQHLRGTRLSCHFVFLLMLTMFIVFMPRLSVCLHMCLSVCLLSLRFAASPHITLIA